MRKAIPIIIVVAVIVVFCLVAVVLRAAPAVRKLLQKPQGTPLSLVTPTEGMPIELTEVIPEPAATATPQPTSLPTQKATPLSGEPSMLTQPEPVCGQSGQMTLLLLGRSIHLPSNNQRADLIRLVKLDFDQRAAYIYAIPGQLVVSTPNLAPKYGTQNARIGDIPTIIFNKDGINTTSEYAATQAVAQAILDNFGIAADHYITIKEDLVMQVVDTFNGIEVNIPQKFTMPSYSKYKGMVLEPGKYVFNGEMVHAYTTYRESVGEEWQRFSRQNVILEGMRAKLLNPAVFLKIPELYELYKQNIVTDLSMEEIIAAGCLAREAPSQSIVFSSIPAEKVKIESDGSMRLLDMPALVGQLQSAFGVP